MSEQSERPDHVTEQPAEQFAADAARRSQLVGLKLRALVRDHLGTDDVPEPTRFVPGAALVAGGDGWVYLDDRPDARLGAALAWALRAGVGSLDVVAERGTGVLARRAAEFAFPIRVWHADGRALLSAIAEPIDPSRVSPPDHDRFRSVMIDAGAEPHTEHGVLTGEVCGLEVCRVVDDPHSGDSRLEVGVGAHDREAFQMLHGNEPTAASLARIVEVVRRHRAPGAEQHPLNRLAAERWLRWRVQQSPQLIGAEWLAAEQPPVPRPNLKDAVPCVATGADPGGRRIVAVFGVGVDLDLVPYAADARRAAVEAAPSGVDGGDPRLLVVTPSRDRLPVVDELAGLLTQPAEVVSVD